jgi:photosystem II stability/assembly factor-like uncharacterized protein
MSRRQSNDSLVLSVVLGLGFLVLWVIGASLVGAHDRVGATALTIDANVPASHTPPRTYEPSSVSLSKASVDWVPVGVEGSAFRLVADPRNPQQLYVYRIRQFDPGTVYASQDGGTSWVAVSEISTWFDGFIAAADGTLYLTSAVRILKSDDGGLSWQVVRAQPPGPDPESFDSFAVDSGASATVYLAVRGNGPGHRILRSTDAGETWSRIEYPDQCGERARLLVDPERSGTVYAVSGDCFHRSVDYGESWDNVRLPTRNTLFLANPARSGHLFLCGYGASLWVSKDHGDSWTKIPGVQLARVIAVDPRDPLGNVLAIAGFIEGDSRDGVYWTDNGGQNWQALGLPPVGSPPRVGPIPAQPYALLVTSDQLLAGMRTGLWSMPLPRSRD